MSIRLKWFAIVAGVIFLGVALIPWHLFEATLKEHVREQIRLATGLETLAEGGATLSLLPRPRVKLETVSIRDDSGRIEIKSAALKGDVRLLPLLAGRVELASAALFAPKLVLDLDIPAAPSQSAISHAVSAPAGTVEATTADLARLGRLSVWTGVARIKSARAGIDTLIEDINGTLDWMRVRDPAGFAGRLTWRGHSGEVAAWMANPVDFLRGGSSTIALRTRFDAFGLAVDGFLSGQGRQFEGRIGLDAPSIRDLLLLAGVGVTLPAPLNNVSLTGEMEATPTEFALSSVRLTADGNRFEGSLALRNDHGHPTVSGTLATEVLAIDPFLTTLPTVFGSDGGWSPESMDMHGLKQGDIDLRISAARASLGRASLEDAALSILCKSGRLEISLGEARAYQGTLKGRAVVSPGASGFDLRANLLFSDVDFSAVTTARSGAPVITGLGTGQMTVAGSGKSIRELARDLDGRLQIQIRSGSISGLDLEQALRHPEKYRILPMAKTGARHTSFDDASATLRLSKGVGIIEQGTMVGPGLSVVFGGKVLVDQQIMNLNAQAMQTTTDGGANTGQKLAFAIAGPWGDPRLLPNKTDQWRPLSPKSTEPEAQSGLAPISSEPP